MANELTKIPKFRRCVLQNFPFIEQDFDALTDYQLLCKVVEYLNKVIEHQNVLDADYTELVNTYNTLVDFVNNYFENLNVQSEINNKLDAMAEDGQLAAVFSEYFADYVNPQIEAQNRRIATVEDQVNSAISGAPKAVASTADMTDHNKIYVLTTDGKWYYWNGSAWTAGGTYQASSLGNGSVGISNLTNQLAEGIYKNSNDITKLSNLMYGANANTVNLTSPMIIKAGTTVTVSEEFVQNYHWNFRRVRDGQPFLIAANNYNINSLNTNTSYTFTNTEYCVLCWSPIDNNWETEDYTVDRRHKLDNSDVTSINYYIRKNDHFKLIDYDNDLAFNNVFGSNPYDIGTVYYDSSRISTGKLYSSYPILLHVKSGLLYDYSVYPDAAPFSQRTSHTGWTTGDRIIPANTHFMVTVRHSDNSGFTSTYDYESLIELNSYADYTYINNYVDNHISTIGTTYNYEGINLDLQYKHGYNYEASTTIPVGYRGIQGFTIYGNYIFQMYANHTMRILDKSSGTILAEHMNLGTDHGGTCAFSNTYYDAEDDFPLLYVSTCNAGGQIKVLRVESVNDVTPIKSYSFDPSEIGYWAEQCFDFENGLVYSFGYTKNSFSDSTDNPVIVCIYDLTKETHISGNIYTLQLVERYTMPYVYTIQGGKFLNGLCYLVSAYQSHVQASNIRVYDPNRKTYVADFPNLPNPLHGEIEDLAFVKNTSTGKYDMIVGVNGDPNYWKLSFM